MQNKEFNKEVGKYRNYYNIFDSLEGNVTEFFTELDDKNMNLILTRNW